MTRWTRLRFTGVPSSRDVSAATIRVPSVGLLLATSTIALSPGRFRPGLAEAGRHVGGR